MPCISRAQQACFCALGKTGAALDLEHAPERLTALKIESNRATFHCYITYSEHIQLGRSEWKRRQSPTAVLALSC